MTSNSSWRGSDCSEVTTTSELHTMPVMWRSCAREMATTAVVAASTRAAMASENCQRVCLISH